MQEGTGRPERADLSVWQLERLRLTMFPSPASGPLSQSSWEELLGRPPDTIELNPRQSSFVARGAWEADAQSAAITLRATPTRIDWQAAPGLDRDFDGFPTFGSASACIPQFRDLMLSWLSRCPPIQRIAFGTVLLLPVASRQEGYDVLSAYLPFQLDLADSSDFQFQVNRRRVSLAVADIELNRLSKWSVAAFSEQTIEFSSEAPARTVTTGEHMAARLELDINTVPSPSTELSGDELASIFRELVELAVEIVQNGLAAEYGNRD